MQAMILVRAELKVPYRRPRYVKLKAPGRSEKQGCSEIEGRLTSEEAAANGSDDDLEGKETTHAEEDVAVLLIDGVETDDVDEGAGGEENGGADGLEEEEVRALLESTLVS